jgi:hypothetical protein
VENDWPAALGSSATDPGDRIRATFGLLLVLFMALRPQGWFGSRRQLLLEK